jgi:MoxR-like ATPase
VSGSPNPSNTLKKLKDAVARVLVGQTELVDGLLIGLLADGHVLVEGVPGLAKTTAVRTLAGALGLDFGRIQFTPDLLPGDLTGNPVYLPDQGRYAVRRGPVFASVLLADEINRAPAKVQSALLEAMEERQVTIGDETLALPEPFFVMATQNPIELEGTYPLPEAQLDRFLMKLQVDYPSESDEIEIVGRDGAVHTGTAAVVDRNDVQDLRRAAASVHVAPEVAAYAVRIVRATRPGAADPATTSLAAGRSLLSEVELHRKLLASRPIRLGASPRASIFLTRAARARALLDGRAYATPDDVKRVARDVLRHRIVLDYEAEADGVTPDAVIRAVLGVTEAP